MDNPEASDGCRSEADIARWGLPYSSKSSGTSQAGDRLEWMSLSSGILRVTRRKRESSRSFARSLIASTIVLYDNAYSEVQYFSEAHAVFTSNHTQGRGMGRPCRHDRRLRRHRRHFRPHVRSPAARDHLFHSQRQILRRQLRRFRGLDVA
ncbi:protein of unknown function [Nitrospira japonica]|uniref:Uncharacterized protein n=1 Tax=Nitrospira japonica TaxID=1325564 RepID=A0A1W1I6P3_9BACT|nr:protein of unknown function [Nitrospira japonica]